MKHCYFLLLGFLCFVNQALAQTDEARWAQAKQLFEEGKYELTLEQLKPLTAIKPSNAYAAQANYLYALTLYRLRDLTQAQGAVQNVIVQFRKSSWPDTTEAYYLAGVIAAERQLWQLSLRYWEKCYTDNIAGDCNNAKIKLLASAPTDTLRILQHQYPADRALALLLVQKLIHSPKLDDRNLSDKLANSFNFSEFKKEVIANSAQNTSMNIALLLPFMLKATNYKSANRNNQAILDFYEGVRMAIDELAGSQNLAVNLMTYDTEKSINKIQEILNYPEIQKANLLVGPIYPQGAIEMAAFAAQNHIPLVNPLTTQRTWNADNAWAFMSEATPETQAMKIAEYAGKTFIGDKVAIVYGVSTKDTVMAFTYKQQMEAMNKKVLLYKQVGKNSAANLIKFLFQAGVDSTTSHIFVPNDEPLVKIQMMGALGVLKLKVPVITYETWLQTTEYTFEEWQRRNIHFIASSYFDDERDEVKRFKKNYLSKVKLMPSVRAYQGYEMMMYYGKMYALHGKDFPQKMKEQGYHKGFILSGFDYKQGNDNQFVPLYKVEDLTMKLVNAPTE